MAFRGCKNLAVVKFGSGLQTLGRAAFAHSSLEKIWLPETLKKLEDNTFSNCENLWQVNFAEGLEVIGSSCFECSGIKEISFPGSLKIIGDRVFYGCSQLRKVAVPEENRLESAGARVFAGVCDDLQLVNFRIFVDLQRTEFDETIIQWTFDL